MKKTILVAIAIHFGIAGFSQTTKEMPTTPWELEVKARMDLMRNIKWTPISTISVANSRRDKFFNGGEEVTGIPYSGVSVTDGFVGINVSFYTFLSAVHNPYSKLYSVNYHFNRAPGMAKNAGPFYGTVCTAAGFYVFGYPTVYLTKLLFDGKVPFMEDLGHGLDKAHVMDAICYHDGKSGHMFIVESITRDLDGKIAEIDLFESTTPVARIRHFTREEIDGFLEKHGLGLDKVFRFHPEQCPWMKQPSFVEQAPGFECSFPEDICLEEGDRMTFSRERDVAVNILCKPGTYKNLVLTKDGKVFKKMSAPKDSIVVFSDLPCGDYRAYLSKGGRKSAPTTFQVASEDFKLRWEEDKLIVYDVPEGVTPIFGYPDPWENTRPMSLAVPSEKEGEWILIDIPENARTTSVTLSGKYSAFNSSQKPVPAR